MSLPLNQVIQGDCIDVLKTFPENSIDCIVTDPPYGLNFMGKAWDKALPPKQAFIEMCRVLKPGALAFVMSSPRQDLMWRMAQLLEESGFELSQSFISWVYACLSNDTEILTKDGWERFNISNIFISKEILIYNHETDRYFWEVPIWWNVYQIKDTMLRIKSDTTDQLVTRNHRCLIEREGKLLHIRGNEITKERSGQRAWTASVPYLEDMSILQETIPDISSMVKKKSKYGSFLFNKLPSKCEYSEILSSIKGIQRKKGVRRKKTNTERKYVGREKLGLERGDYLFQDPRKLYRREICSIPKRVHFNDSERWLCNGTSTNCSKNSKSFSIESRGCSSPRSRSNQQCSIKFSSVRHESRSQTSRTRKSYRTTMATITPEYYEGWVFCPTVSTGSFVARRNGKIFLTGNSGFPKAYDVSKGIDAKGANHPDIIKTFKKWFREQIKKCGKTQFQINEECGFTATSYYKMDGKDRWTSAFPTQEKWIKIKKVMNLTDEWDWIIKRYSDDREKIGEGQAGLGKNNPALDGGFKPEYDLTEPSSDLAKKWSGWKAVSGLKPALEVIFMVQKPLSEKTTVDNVLKWGTGAMNVDGCRIPSNNSPKSMMGQGYASITKENVKQEFRPKDYYEEQNGFKYNPSEKGRFPANILVSDDVLNDGKTTHSNIRTVSETEKNNDNYKKTNIYGKYNEYLSERGVEDSGSFSRYFDLDAWAQHHGILQVPKASTSERDGGLTGEKKEVLYEDGRYGSHEIFSNKYTESSGNPSNRGQTPKHTNIHPTVKPIKLMTYLVTLGCPSKGVVLDPFVGSGTTCIAAKQLSRNYIGIELSPEYAEMARKRIESYFENLDMVFE